MRPLIITAALVVVALLLPRFGRTYEVMRGWADQSFYMRLLDLADAGKVGEALSANYMGPTYIAMVQALKSAFALDSIGALVLLNRSFVALAIAVPVAAYVGRRAVDERFLAALGIFGLFLASTPFMYASSIPWSHYVSGLFGVSFLLALSFRMPLVAGVALGLLATTRLFEAGVLSILTVVYFGTVATVNWKGIDPRKYIHCLGWAVFGFGIGYCAHVIVLGQIHFFYQYSGLIGSTEAYNGSSIRFLDLPVKIVQFFIDPCYYSVCNRVDYQKTTILVSESDGGLLNWRMPFLLQLPFYAAVMVGGLVLIARRWRLSLYVFRDPVIFVGVGAAIGLPLAYFSYLVGGADQLKYGFVRELFFPSLCLLVIVLRLLTSDYINRAERTLLFWSITLVAIGLQVLPAVFGFPRLTSAHITSMSATADCQNGECSISLSYANPSGETLRIPFDKYAMIRAECSDQKVIFTGVVELDSFRIAPTECDGAMTIIGLSTTTGMTRWTRDRRIGGKVIISAGNDG